MHRNQPWIIVAGAVVAVGSIAGASAVLAGADRSPTLDPVTDAPPASETVESEPTPAVEPEPAPASGAVNVVAAAPAAEPGEIEDGVDEMDDADEYDADGNEIEDGVDEMDDADEYDADGNEIEDGVDEMDDADEYDADGNEIEEDEGEEDEDED